MVDYEISSNISQIVVTRIESIRAALSCNLNLIAIPTDVRRGCGIYCVHAVEGHRIYRLSIREHAVSIKIRHRKGGLIQNHGISVNPLLLRSRQRDRPLVHYQVASYITQVVVTRAEPVGSGLSRDLNLVGVGAHIACSCDIYSSDTIQSHRVDDFPVGKHAITIKIKKGESCIIKSHRVSIDPLLLGCRQGHRPLIDHQITVHVTQVVVSWSKPSRAGLIGNHNFITITAHTSSCPCIHSIRTRQRHGVDDLPVGKNRITIKIKKSEGRVIQ